MSPLNTNAEPQLYQTHHYYKHLSPEDSELWTMFIETHPKFAEQVYYDFPVGSTPMENFTHPQPWTEAYAKQTYSKRIDVVAIKGPYVTVIELKPSAGMIALGQILMYRKCITDDLTGKSILRSMIITDSADPDLLELTQAHGIELIQLAPIPKPSTT